jgi:hypothetical protein
VSQEVARLEELLARVQRNAALPRTLPAAFAAAPSPEPVVFAAAPAPAPTPPAPVVSAPPPPAAPVFAAPEVAFDPEPLQPEFEAPLPYPPVGDHEARQVQPAALDQSVDDMLLADPFPSVAPAPPAQQSLTDMLDEDASPHVSASGQQVAPGEDISGVMNRSDLADEPPEELLEDDIVEMTPGEAEAVVPAGNSLDDLNFDDEELSGTSDRRMPSDEPPASSSRHKVAGTMDEALARAAEQIEHDEGREVPLKTPPPESGPQAAMALPVGIHAPLAPDIEELLEADILPVGGVHADLPTTEQLGQTIELEEARGPHLELDSTLAAAPHHEQPHEELEVTLPRREFGGGYQDDLMPPPEARQDLDAHRQRFGDESVPPPPESLGQYPSQQPAAATDGFAPQIVPASVTTDSHRENVSTVTVDAPAHAEFAPELLARPEIAAAPVAKFIRVEPARPNTFLELLDASLALGSN